MLVPDSVRQGVPGHSEACGHGLQSRGKLSPSSLQIFKVLEGDISVGSLLFYSS